MSDPTKWTVSRQCARTGEVGAVATFTSEAKARARYADFCGVGALPGRPRLVKLTAWGAGRAAETLAEILLSVPES